ncbi:hypothetical protein FACS189449_10640 [Alphaproteobacteria bacterium]|nr:hypothetical protein FACS189449_10640 [Alphaproteobacteria bacterium]
MKKLIYSACVMTLMSSHMSDVHAVVPAMVPPTAQQIRNDVQARLRRLEAPPRRIATAEIARRDATIKAVSETAKKDAAVKATTEKAMKDAVIKAAAEKARKDAAIKAAVDNVWRNYSVDNGYANDCRRLAFALDNHQRARRGEMCLYSYHDIGSENRIDFWGRREIFIGDAALEERAIRGSMSLLDIVAGPGGCGGSWTDAVRYLLDRNHMSDMDGFGNLAAIDALYGIARDLAKFCCFSSGVQTLRMLYESCDPNGYHADVQKVGMIFMVRIVVLGYFFNGKVKDGDRYVPSPFASPAPGEPNRLVVPTFLRLMGSPQMASALATAPTPMVKRRVQKQPTVRQNPGSADSGSVGTFWGDYTLEGNDSEMWCIDLALAMTNNRLSGRHIPAGAVRIRINNAELQNQVLNACTILLRTVVGDCDGSWTKTVSYLMNPEHSAERDMLNLAAGHLASYCYTSNDQELRKLYDGYNPNLFFDSPERALRYGVATIFMLRTGLVGHIFRDLNAQPNTLPEQLPTLRHLMESEQMVRAVDATVAQYH